MKKNSPNILIISNNSLSQTKNNGKTLYSFFEDFPQEKINQLYFTEEFPDINKKFNFFRITDKEMKNSFFKKEFPGKKIVCKEEAKEKILFNEKKFFRSIKTMEIFRIVREVIWRSRKWNNIKLNNWLEEVKPDIIFFCAGDSGFAYDIVEYIKDKYQSKVFVYITDDYILPRLKINVFWWIRRGIIIKKMRKCILYSDKLLTISEEMSEKYEEIFKKRSTKIINISKNLKENTIVNNSKIKFLIYAGGLHFNRDKILIKLGKALQQYNKNHSNEKYILKIYTTQKLEKKEELKLNIKNGSIFCGGLEKKELELELNKAEIPVHVESFDRKSIESTRLSISTKIPEYLSLGKPILSIGPEKISSIKYLKDVSFTINNLNNLNKELKDFLENDLLKKELSQKSIDYYNEKHNEKKVKENFEKHFYE